MRKRPLSVGCLVVVILICIVTSLSRKEPWSCPELEGQTVIVQGRVYQKEVKTQGGQDKTVVYLKQVSFTGDNPVEGQSVVQEEATEGQLLVQKEAAEKQLLVQEEAAERQLLVQEKAAERQLLVQEEAAEKQLLVQGKCAEKPADTKATENILCYLREGVPEPEIGSLVILKGTLKNFQQPTNPGQFNAPFYYQILRISFRLNQAEIQVKSDRFYKIAEGLYQLRRKAGSKVDALLPEQEASVMKTMLLGEKGILDEEIKGLYQRNGIAHILAISGLHISMIGMGLYQLLRRAGLKIKLSAILASMIIVLYGMMTGFAVSAIRAIAMFLLQMLAQILGRTYDRITALAVAAVLVLVEQPLYLFHSGFQFSFLCVLGISLILPVLGNVRKGKKLFEGVALMAVTLPVYLGVFYQIPVYSMFLNFIVLPMMSILMGAGIVMILAAFLCTPLAIPAAWLITGILMVYERIGLFTEKLPHHYWTPGCPAKWQLAVYVAVLIIIAALGRTKRKAVLYQKDCIHRRGGCAKEILQEQNKRIRRIACHGGKWISTYGIPVGICWGFLLLGVVILTWRFRPELQVTFLDVGQGDCIFLQTEDGASYLTDGGSSSVSKVGKYRMIPFLKYQGASQIKAVFVSHADSDHCNGIAELLEQAELEGIRVENLVLTDIADECRSEGYEELVELAGQNGITVQLLHEGQQLQDGELLFQCLHPSKGYRAEDLNETSMVLLVTYREFSMLLTGDVQGAGEEHLTQELQDWKEPGVAQMQDVIRISGEEESMEEESIEEQSIEDERIEEQIEEKRPQNKMGANHTETELTILKVAHHGSKNSTSEEFLKAANPKIAIISCGKGNRYGHPHEETLERLEKADVPWFCTKDYGAITVTVDDKSRVQVRGYIAD
jgi:competence protein ComEC